MNSPLISTDELARQLGDPRLVVLDASWHLAERDPLAEFQQRHIPSARFFDIDDISDKNSPLPHMLPKAGQFANAAGALGISNHSRIVVYDSIGLASAARCWWTFRIFGHRYVRVLNGGLPKWVSEGRAVTSEPTVFDVDDYRATLLAEHVADKEQVEKNCDSGHAVVLDARPADRFSGESPEPRPGLKRGQIPNSRSLPFATLVKDGILKDRSALIDLFHRHDIGPETAVITSCGSGVTAAIITLALTEAGYGLHRLYDGSWAEWGAR